MHKKIQLQIKYKDLQVGSEFIFNGIVFIKNSWISAQIKGKQKFLSIQPSAKVEIAHDGAWTAAR